MSDTDPAVPHPQRPRLIVGLGASAGGLDPLEQFFDAVPADSGMAFVVVQHLSPDYPSLMHELLGRHTTLPIHRVTDGMPVEANAIYLIPARMMMEIKGGVLGLYAQDRGEDQPPLPIDIFFNSLAADQGKKAVAIVLSGTGTDGSRGVRRIKSAGGLVIAQDETTAKFSGMPRATKDTGVVDADLGPDEMPGYLAAYVKDPASIPPTRAEDIQTSLEGIDAVLSLLGKFRDIDFTLYKPATIHRRIERRVLLNPEGDLNAYLDRLRNDEEELHQLYRDLLIGVTQFFRDPTAYESLRNTAVTPLFENRGDDEEIRVWIAGCATGEEAYSIAILLDEARRALDRPRQPIRVFATDVHRSSIEFASAGRYQIAALREVSPERLQRYFQPYGDGFQVRPDLRRMVTFAPQNMISDAPFTRMDLVTCRNVLIYFRSEVQARVISLLHFALNVGGFLFLGPSETTQPYRDEFDPLDAHWRIYRKRRSVRLLPPTRLPTRTPMPTRPPVRGGAALAPTAANTPDARLLGAYDAMLAHVVDAAVVVNGQREPVHIFGDARRLLQPPTGRQANDLLAMLDDNLRPAVTAALQKARVSSGDVSIGRVRLNPDETVVVSAEQVREASGELGYVIVRFRFAQRPAATAGSDNDDGTAPGDFDPARGVDPQTMMVLEAELSKTRDNLQSTIEELETTNEELNATNEELVASNEELQSTNEELHSVNEELHTVNAEYQQKITELTRLTDDMNNLLSSTAIGTLFLGPDLKVRSFTPAVQGLFSIREADVDRPLEEVRRTFAYPTLMDDAREVMRSGEPHQHECPTEDDRWMLVRLTPYLMANDDKDGLVITLVDISEVKAAERAVEFERQLTQEVLDAVPSMVLLKDNEDNVLRVNRLAAEHVGLPREEIEGRPAGDTFGEVASASRADDRAVLRSGRPRLGVEEAVRDDRGVLRDIRTDKIPIFHDDGTPRGLVTVISDVTELNQMQAELSSTNHRLELALRSANAGLWEWDVLSQHVYMNDTYFTMLGYGANELPHHFDTWRQLCHPDELDRGLEELTRYIEGQSDIYRFPHRMRRKDGGWHWVLAKGEVTERTQDGQPSKICGLHIDIDDIKQAEARLEANNASLEGRVRQRTAELIDARDQLEMRVQARTSDLVERNEQLDQFARVASHDLRSPLRTILGFAEHLRTIAPESPESSDALDRIDGAARRMSELIDSLLEFASVGRAEFAYQQVDLNTSLLQATEDLAPEIQSSDADIVTKGELPVVSGDRAMLRQVMQNLVGNAIKYRSDATPQIVISAERDAAFETVHVRDNGIGFDASDAPRAFEPFQRIYRGRELRGSGIGLSICKRVIERHGGNITVETAPGQGSTFSFTIPRQQEDDNR